MESQLVETGDRRSEYVRINTILRAYTLQGEIQLQRMYTRSSTYPNIQRQSVNAMTAMNTIIQKAGTTRVFKSRNKLY